MKPENEKAYKKAIACIPVDYEIKTRYKELLEAVFLAGIAEGLKRAYESASK